LNIEKRSKPGLPTQDRAIMTWVSLYTVLYCTNIRNQKFGDDNGLKAELTKGLHFMATTHSNAPYIKLRFAGINLHGEVLCDCRPVALGSLLEAILPLDRNTPILISADRDLAIRSFVDAPATVKNGFRRASIETGARR
jgi:hypothetical protein